MKSPHYWFEVVISMALGAAVTLLVLASGWAISELLL